MKKLFISFALLSAFSICKATVPEFSLHVKLFIKNDSARTVIFGYDPIASDSMIYKRENWFSDEFYGGEQLYPPGQTGDLDFRMSGYYVNRPELGIDGSDGGPIDISKKPTVDRFTRQFGIEFHPVPGTTIARMDWDPQSIPAIIKHITLASFHFPHTLRLDMKNTGSFVFPLKDSGEDLYSNMILTLYYNEDIPIDGVADLNTPEAIAIYPNPMNARSRLHFTMNEDCNIALSAYDVTGKKIFERKVNAFAGDNTIDLAKNDFSSHPGVYLIRLSGIEGSNIISKSQTLIVR